MVSREVIHLFFFCEVPHVLPSFFPSPFSVQDFFFLLIPLYATFSQLNIWNLCLAFCFSSFPFPSSNIYASFSFYSSLSQSIYSDTRTSHISLLNSLKKRLKLVKRGCAVLPSSSWEIFVCCDNATIYIPELLTINIQKIFTVFWE